ncbi:MAG: NAD-dependent epimerase/dehydratase family protein [Elusimicrobiota bacterium]
MRILLTGANGFVGGFVSQSLRARGCEVKGALRKRDAAGAIDAIEIGDIGPKTDWNGALDGVDVVIHLAARAHRLKDKSPNPAADFMRVNAAGTEALARAAAARGVKRFVLLSSIQVHGVCNQGPNPLTEASPARPVEPYALSKWEAEKILWEIQSKSGMEAVVIRPPLVYGPGNIKGNMRRLLDAIYRGMVFPVGSFKNARSFIGLENLADAVHLCAARKEAANQTFVVCDGDDASTAGLIGKIAQAMGKKPRVISLPKPFLDFVGALVPPLGRSLKRLGDSLTIDNGKFKRAFNWTPPKSLDRGIEEMASYYLSHESWKTAAP